MFAYSHIVQSMCYISVRNSAKWHSTFYIWAGVRRIVPLYVKHIASLIWLLQNIFVFQILFSNHFWIWINATSKRKAQQTQPNPTILLWENLLIATLVKKFALEAEKNNKNVTLIQRDTLVGMIRIGQPIFFLFEQNSGRLNGMTCNGFIGSIAIHSMCTIRHCMPAGITVCVWTCERCN